MRRGSLRLRLAAIGAVAVLVALTAAAFGLARLFEQHVERRAAAELSAHLDQLVAGLERDAQGRLTLARRPADPRFQAPLSGLYWQIGPADEAALRSRSLWDSALPLPADPLDGAEHRHRLAGPGGAPLLVLERRVTLPPRLGGEAVRVAVAVERREIEVAAEAFLRDMLPYLGLLALALSLAGWAQLSVGLRPLRRVGERVAAVRSGRAARLGEAFPQEVRPLAAQVDDLIAAREAEAERARRRAADLAHGLKTPLQA
ncbi:MAG: sensor histidine kinase, partial [Pseudomonadota bacterium]